MQCLALIADNLNSGNNMSTVAALSLADFNPAADAQLVYDGQMTAGSAVLTSASGKFSSADVGKQIHVGGAGAASSGFPNKLVSTIASYESPTQVTLANAATTTVPNPAVPEPGVIWGTDDAPAFQAALNSIANGVDSQDLIIPAGNYLVSSPVYRNFQNTLYGVKIIGQGLGTRIYSTAVDYDNATLFQIVNLWHFSMENILFVGCPGAPVDCQYVLSVIYVRFSDVRCEFFGLGFRSDYIWRGSNYGGGAIECEHGQLNCKSRFMGTMGGFTVSLWDWSGFIDEGSEFVDYAYLDGGSISKSSITSGQWANGCAIYIGDPWNNSATRDGPGSQNKVQIRNTLIDEDQGIPIKIITAAGGIDEVEIDGVRIDGKSLYPSIDIQGVKHLKINGWVGYNSVAVNDAVVLANVGTAHLQQFLAEQLSNRITAASTVGTLILEDCTYTTLVSSAAQTIITQKGQVTPPTYTVAGLPTPTAANSGFRAQVTDSNATMAAGIGTAVTEGGTNFVPVYCDGTQWLIG
jgi:hypothetical protein